MRRNWKAPAATLLVILTLCSLAGYSGVLAKYVASATYQGAGRVARWGPPTPAAPMGIFGYDGLVSNTNERFGFFANASNQEHVLKFHQSGGSVTRAYTTDGTNTLRVTAPATIEVGWNMTEVPTTIIQNLDYRKGNTFSWSTAPGNAITAANGNGLFPHSVATTANYRFSLTVSGVTADGCARYHIGPMTATQAD